MIFFYQLRSQVFFAVMTFPKTCLKVSKDINRELETIVMSPLQEMPWAEAVAEMPCPRRVDD